MLDGITVIDVVSKFPDGATNFLTAYGCFLFVVAMCICIGLWRWRMDKVPLKKARVWILIGVSFGFLMGCVAVKFFATTPFKQATIYKVELSDDLNFGEFKSRYKINSQEGQYYYIEEIEVEDNK
jgi:hypothetical protein